MALLDIAKLRATPLQSDPYNYLVVEQFIRPEAFAAVVADYPEVAGPGSFPLSEVDVHGRFEALIDELNGDAFREVVEEKFGLDLSDKPTMFTVRGECRATDGKIHTDSKTKIITVLLYMNDNWDAEGGRLRLLRSGEDLNAVAAEVPPNGGTLLVFRRAENSWHGHEPYEGKRRAVQMNWVTGADVVSREQFRHRVSAAVKSFKRKLIGASA
jgi:hypothetical protein